MIAFAVIGWLGVLAGIVIALWISGPKPMRTRPLESDDDLPLSA